MISFLWPSARRGRTFVGKIDIKSETRAAEAELEELRQGEAAAEAEAVAAEADVLAGEHTRDELYEMAKAHNIAGRSSMTKEELAQSLAELDMIADEDAEATAENQEAAEEK